MGGSTDKKKKKSKESKKRKRHNNYYSSDSSADVNSDSDSRKKSKRHKKSKKQKSKDKTKAGKVADKRMLNFVKIREVLQSVLQIYPHLVKDLLALFTSLDNGGAVVLSGIQDTRLRFLLVELFENLNVDSCLSNGQAGYMLPKGAVKLNAKLNSEINDVLKKINELKKKTAEEAHTSKDSYLINNDSCEVNTTLNEEKRVNNVEDKSPTIGPSLPSSRSNINQSTGTTKTPIGPSLPTAIHTHHRDNESEMIVGPALPVSHSSLSRGDSSMHYHDPYNNESYNKRIAEEASKETANAWKRVRGGDGAMEDDSVAKRESWMTDIPTDRIGLSDIASLLPTENKNRFNKKSNSGPVDHSSWTQNPEERVRTQIAKGHEEFLGYIDPSSRSKAASSTTNNSNNSAISSYFKTFNETHRDKSLLEKHQEEGGRDGRTKAKKRSKRGKSGEIQDKILKTREEELAPNFTWNRERDLMDGGSSHMNSKKMQQVIRESKEISTRFTRPTTTRSFV